MNQTILNLGLKNNTKSNNNLINSENIKKKNQQNDNFQKI